jgi:anti-sigma factor RsiW
MNCEELIHYLSDYIDRNLSDELQAEAQEHLATCHNCHVVLDTTRQTIYLYRQSGRQAIPSEHRSELFARLQQSLAGRKDLPS